MPPNEQPVTREDLIRLLRPILADALQGSLRAGEIPSPERLSALLAAELAPRLEWSAFAGVLEAVEPQLAGGVPLSDQVERGMGAFARALRAGPPEAEGALAGASRPSPYIPRPPAPTVVLGLLRSAPEHAFTMPEISEGTGLSEPVAAQAVSELVQFGHLVRDGFYIRLPSSGDELPPREWEPDDPTQTPDRRHSDRRVQDRRQGDRRRES